MMQNSGALRVARMRTHIPSAVMPRLDRGIQYAAAYRLKHARLWDTGSPGRVFSLRTWPTLFRGHHRHFCPPSS
jgi:hypothetical protein